MHASVHHMTLSVADIDKSVGFYDKVLEPLGLLRCAEFGDEEEDEAATEAVAYAAVEVAERARRHADSAQVEEVQRGTDAPFWLVAATDAATQNVHVAFQAASRAEVQALFDTAIAAGGATHSAPRR